MLRETELICRCCFALYLNYKQTNKKLFTPARIAWNCLKRALLLLFSFFFFFSLVCVCLLVCMLACLFSRFQRFFLVISVSWATNIQTYGRNRKSLFFVCSLSAVSNADKIPLCIKKKKKKTSKWNKKRGKRREIRWRATPWRYAISLIWKRVDKKKKKAVSIVCKAVRCHKHKHKNMPT